MTDNERIESLSGKSRHRLCAVGLLLAIAPGTHGTKGVPWLPVHNLRAV